jgi:Protein of unknown function (DUF3224)
MRFEVNCYAGVAVWRLRMVGERFARALIAVTLLSGSAAHAQNVTTNSTAGATMHATGTFEVKVKPEEAPAVAKEAGLALFSLDKTFSGELEATSKGEMLSGNTESTGAMAYVAMERVTGKLKGRSGSFLLMHNASMLKTEPKSGVMSVVVVPHSGTDELTGLSGKMSIIIEGGKHSYDFEYQLP